MKSSPDNNYKMKIGENIRKWREFKGFKQERLAQGLRLSKAALSNIENNKSDLSLRRIEDIARELDVPVEQLFVTPEQYFSFDESNNDQKKFSPQPQISNDKKTLNSIFERLEKNDLQMQIFIKEIVRSVEHLINFK